MFRDHDEDAVELQPEGTMCDCCFKREWTKTLSHGTCLCKRCYLNHCDTLEVLQLEQTKELE